MADDTDSELRVENGRQTEDAELLRRYVAEKSEAAFAELVRRHLDLVYAVALRQVGGRAHLAEEVAQVVFTALARKAAALAARPVLGGWLYRTAQFTAVDVVRAESRRRARETEVFLMQDTTTDGGGGAVDWEKIRPTLDRVIGELREEERDAVVLRFFEGNSFAEVGVRLRLSENAARMRVERALDKLHAGLARRGVTSTSAALGLALTKQATAVVPAGLAASVTGAALAGAGATWWVGSIFMSMTKLKFSLTVAALAVVGATAWVVQQRVSDRRQAVWQEEVARLQQQVAMLLVEARENASLRAENWRLSDLVARARAASTGTVRGAVVGTGAKQDQLEKKGRDRWRNVGRATPAEAYETVMWASDRGDVDLLVESFVLSEAQRTEANAVFMRFSEEVRSKYGTAERMMALLFSSGTPAIFQPLAETSKSVDDVTVRARVWNDRGESNELELAFRRYPEGWRVVIPDWQMNKSLARLRK